jgi:hypothetical protein
MGVCCPECTRGTANLVLADEMRWKRPAAAPLGAFGSWRLAHPVQND